MKTFSILEDNSGGTSSIRVLMLAWGLGVLLSWGYISYKTNTLATIPESVIVILGSTMVSKVTQRFSEKSEPETK